MAHTAWEAQELREHVDGGADWLKHSCDTSSTCALWIECVSWCNVKLSCSADFGYAEEGG